MAILVCLNQSKLQNFPPKQPFFSHTNLFPFPSFLGLEHDHDHDHDHDNEDDDDDEMEQEEMFVEAHESFGHGQKEWGGPRRGGRLPEPTRFGDWERKGRCTDF